VASVSNWRRAGAKPKKIDESKFGLKATPYSEEFPLLLDICAETTIHAISQEGRRTANVSENDGYASWRFQALHLNVLIGAR
jgi:hypothetical protein